MSEQKTAHVVASVNNGMSMAGSRYHGRVRFQAKLLGPILFVCAVSVAIIGCVLWNSSGNSTSPKTKSAISAPPAGITQEQRAQYYADKGQYDQAEQSWQMQLSDATNTSDKVSILYQQSVLAARFKRYTDAKNYADQAKQLTPDSPVPYSALALLAQTQNNKPLAQKYWQQAINNVNSNMPGYNLIINDYQKQLDALK